MALDVHVLADDLRATAERHYAWDLVRELIMMTDTTIAEIDK